MGAFWSSPETAGNSASTRSPSSRDHLNTNDHFLNSHSSPQFISGSSTYPSVRNTNHTRSTGNDPYYQKPKTFFQPPAQQKQRAEDGKYFGHYQCDCGQCWTSAHSWKNQTQDCKTCHSPVLAYKQEALTKNQTEKNTSKPHEEGLCGKCRSLGYSCAIIMARAKNDTRHNPNDIFVRGLPNDITPDRLRSMFNSLGTILRVHLLPIDNKRPGRVGFITFEDPDRALRLFNDASTRASNSTASISRTQYARR